MKFARAGESRWRGIRVVIVAAAIVFGGLSLLARSASGYGFAGFVIWRRPLCSRAARPGAEPAGATGGRRRTRGEPLEAVIAGVPDPVSRSIGTAGC